jgi:hydroxysqualene dehydroxylase
MTHPSVASAAPQDGGEAAVHDVAVIGAGWAGLAAAVQCRRLGLTVRVHEMAPHPGGRARSVGTASDRLDCGQHILIGAYRETLALMHQVGVQPEQVLRRSPLALVGPDGRGLSLPPGPAPVAFARAVWARQDWPLGERIHLVLSAARWALQGFRCPPSTTVSQWSSSLGAGVRRDLIDPLCIAALNTPSEQASASVFLRVLRDALFGSRGSADLLLPRRPLAELLPEPAWEWLSAQGVALQAASRVQRLEPQTVSASGPNRSEARWRLHTQAAGEPRHHDAHTVVLACSAQEAARLSADHAPAWSALAASFRYEPIATVYVRCAGLHLPQPMVALPSDPMHRPAQFLFDCKALLGRPGLVAMVVSGAAPWVERGVPALEVACLEQLRAFWPGLQPTVHRTLVEKRATFACTPGLLRPPGVVAPGLWAAGDYVHGPYPATLEGAVRSGLAAAAAASMSARAQDT